MGVVVRRLKVAADLMASAGIVVISILICLNLLTHKTISLSRAIGNSDSTGSLKGANMPTLSSYRWAGHPETLVLAIRKGCHFCEESMPFYRHLSELQSEHKLIANILVVTPDDKDTSAAMLRDANVYADNAYSEQLSELGVTGTPTIMLVNQNGRVVESWMGKQVPKGESSIIDSASRPATESFWSRLVP